MDFGLRSAKNPRQEGAELGWCEINSLLLKRRGLDGYDFGLTLQGYVVRHGVDAINHISPAQQAAPQGNEMISGHIRFDQDALFKHFNGLRDIFSCAIHDGSCENADSHPGHSQSEKKWDHGEETTDRNPETSLDFDTTIYAEVIPPDLAVEHAVDYMASPSNDPFFNDYTLDTEDVSLSALIGLEIDFVSNSGTGADFAAHESNSSQSFSIDGDDIAVSLTSPESNPSPIVPINGRHICHLCNTTFKRSGDLKRHSKRHFPEQRNFHCSQPHCGRNGKHGFYRRDKLQAHQRQVHNM